jgi:hypothetical protein
VADCDGGINVNLLWNVVDSTGEYAFNTGAWEKGSDRYRIEAI